MFFFYAYDVPVESPAHLRQGFSVNHRPRIGSGPRYTKIIVRTRRKHVVYASGSNLCVGKYHDGVVRYIEHIRRPFGFDSK